MVYITVQQSFNDSKGYLVSSWAEYLPFLVIGTREFETLCVLQLVILPHHCVVILTPVLCTSDYSFCSYGLYHLASCSFIKMQPPT